MKKKVTYTLFFFLILYLILLIPTEKLEEPKLARKKQFVWNRDSLWNSLEELFANAKTQDCSKLNIEIKKSFQSMNTILESIEKYNLPPDDKKYLEIETSLFYSAALVGACQEGIDEFIKLYSKIRNVVKDQSAKWNLDEIKARQTLYKLIYGGRAAVEELLLQTDKNKIPDLIIGKEEKSFTPQSVIKGLVVNSGDILVSRGGAPTSALIARGSDYPGNFSHIALVYVDERTSKLSIIESHIEKGVTVSSAQDYLNDKKLRIMILRLKENHPAFFQDKLSPHKAAKLIYDRASSEHIPYDFEMDYSNDSKLFCSEVASSAYKKIGVNLWMSISSISSRGIAKWLSGFGVKYFVTQEPSDLEYDPQLSVIAEWRNPETLFQDHIDNAITEALLDEANIGKELKYDWYLLPVSRIMKLYSVILNSFGKEGPIPEGMKPEAGLRHKKLVSLHNTIKREVESETKIFKKKRGYIPPYWKLVSFAKKVIKENNLL